MNKNGFNILHLLSLFLIFVSVNRTTLFAKENFILYTINLPEEAQDIDLSRILFTEDINQDGLLDILFIIKNNLYISEQKKEGGFSDFYFIPINLSGAIDFGDIIPGDEKEILIMHQHGVSYFKKESGKWSSAPISLIKESTLYEDHNTDSLKREHFVIDLDNDGIPELILWGKKAINIYYKDIDKYKLSQSIPFELKEYLSYPGLVIAESPMEWIMKTTPKNIFKKTYPINSKYLYFFNYWSSYPYRIEDFNHDSMKDLIEIKPIENHVIGSKDFNGYEYRIHLLNKNKNFSEIPDIIITDPHGSWLDSNCVDIDNNGYLDFLEIIPETAGDWLKRPKYKLMLFLSDEKGNYHNEPTQIIETSDYPLGGEILIDVDGDKKKDLILIHPLDKSFSIGSIINEFMEKGIIAEIRVLPFLGDKGFSKNEFIRKRIKIKFAEGLPISLSGDFNGDGLRDLLVIDEDNIKIYPFLHDKREFSLFPSISFKLEKIYKYIIKDLNMGGKSDLIIFTKGNQSLKIILFEASPHNGLVDSDQNESQF